jgi:hypothetical protein
LLAVGRGNVVFVPVFVARAEAAGLALGDKGPAGDEPGAIIFELGSSPAAGATGRIHAPSRAFSDEANVAMAAE